ncbi:MAG: peptidase associated/transthyretin-like domain-containing protein [Planctomycetota bacterium]
MSILLAASGFAQDAKPDLPRGKALGEVRGKDGKPWVGARVFLRSWPLPKNIRVGSPDVVETRTDERGRFRARILEGRQYTVWAQGQPDADGKVRLSNVVEQVVVQMPVILKAAQEPVAPRKAMITGLDKWSDYHPFRVRLVDEIGNPRVLPVQVDKDGKCQVPVIIGKAGAVEVLATGPQGDMFLVRGRLLQALPEGDAEGDAEGGPEKINVSPPAKMGFAIWDITTKKPVAGAKIYQHESSSNQMCLLATTDKDGFAEAVVPESQRRGYNQFIAVAEGRAAAPCQQGVSKNKVFAKVHEDKDQKVHYHAHLGAGRKVQGRVFLSPGRPAARMTLVLEGSAMHYQTKNSRNLATYVRVSRTDDEGRFELGSLLREYPPTLLVLLEPKHVAKLPASWRAGMHPMALAPIDMATRMAKTKPVDIVLADLCPVELQVQTPQGIPAAGARVCLNVLSEGIGSRGRGATMTTDRRGRIRLLLPAAARLGLSIDTGDAFLLTCLETRAVAGDRNVAHLPIKLPPPVERQVPAPRLRGRGEGHAARGPERRPADGLRKAAQPPQPVLLADREPQRHDRQGRPLHPGGARVRHAVQRQRVPAGGRRPPPRERPGARQRLRGRGHRGGAAVAGARPWR